MSSQDPIRLGPSFDVWAPRRVAHDAPARPLVNAVHSHAAAVMLRKSLAPIGVPAPAFVFGVHDTVSHTPCPAPPVSDEQGAIVERTGPLIYPAITVWTGLADGEKFNARTPGVSHG